MDNIKNRLMKLKILGETQRFFEGKGVELYLVGGYIRDMLLGRDTRDLDFTFKGNVIKLVREYARKIKGAFVLLDEENVTARIVYKERREPGCAKASPFAKASEDRSSGEWCLDFTAMAGKDINQDLQRRDFAFNAMAVNLQDLFRAGKPEIIDPFNGIKDLKKGIIRMVSEKAFSDDPLRLLRAFRFAASLDMAIDPKTLGVIRKKAGLISRPSRERIREEIFAVFSAGDSCSHIAEIDRAGIFERLFPVARTLKKEKGLWKHSVSTLGCLEKIIGNKISPGLNQGQKKEVLSHLSEIVCYKRTRAELLKFACLFHDTGKPRTKKKKDNRLSFYGHEHKGAEIMEKLCQGLRLSNREARMLENIVKFHMRTHYLANLEKASERAVSKLIRDCGDELVELLYFSLADFLATPPELKKLKPGSYRETIKRIYARYVAAKKIKNLPRLITGFDLMKEFSLKPGPVIGKLLNEVELARSENKIGTREEALGLAKSLLKGALCRKK